LVASRWAIDSKLGLVSCARGPLSQKGKRRQSQAWGCGAGGVVHGSVG